MRRVLEKHGLGYRAQERRTRLDHVTVSRMASGYVPSMPTVAQFARAFDLDVNEWLELAGYPRIKPSLPDAIDALAEPARFSRTALPAGGGAAVCSTERLIPERVAAAVRTLREHPMYTPNPAELLLQRLQELQARHPRRDITLPRFAGGWAPLTLEEVEQCVALMELKLREEDEAQETSRP